MVASGCILYQKEVRDAILAVSNAQTHTARIARLNFLLGELFADALTTVCEASHTPVHSIDLIGSHGQTIFHEGEAVEFCGRTVASTLQIGEAAVIARRIGAPHIELDSMHWGPNWTEVDDDLFKDQLIQTLSASGDAWVIDGNYAKVRDVVWSKAEMVVWLDYSLATIWWQLLKRTLWRVTVRETLWHGNRESLRTAFLSRDSLFVWTFQTHGLHRVNYPAALALPEHSHISLVHLRSPRQTRRWLAGIRPGTRD